MNKGVIYKNKLFFEYLLTSNYLDFSDAQIWYTYTVDEEGGKMKIYGDFKRVFQT